MDSIQPNLTGRAVPRLALSPDEAAASAGVSRTKIFEAIRDGALTARKSGKATIVELAELQRWIHSLPTRSRTPDALSSAKQPQQRSHLPQQRKPAAPTDDLDNGIPDFAA
jgi:excisionase family DNA binding protein